MSVLIVIPARHASTRYPGKPLVELRGASGQARSLIRRSWDAAMALLSQRTPSELPGLMSAKRRPAPTRPSATL